MGQGLFLGVGFFSDYDYSLQAILMIAMQL